LEVRFDPPTLLKHFEKTILVFARPLNHSMNWTFENR
jgi:hypothetical protein